MAARLPRGASAYTRTGGALGLEELTKAGLNAVKSRMPDSVAKSHRGETATMSSAAGASSRGTTFVQASVQQLWMPPCVPSAGAEWPPDVMQRGLPKASSGTGPTPVA